MTVKISNLPLDVTEPALEELFLSYGFDEIEIKRIEDGKDEKIAYVQLKDEATEEDAVEKLNGEQWHGRYLRVDIGRGKNGDKGVGQPTSQGSRPPQGNSGAGTNQGNSGAGTNS